MSPQGSDFVLATDVPHGEADVFVFDCFYVETYIAQETAYNSVCLMY